MTSAPSSPERPDTARVLPEQFIAMLDASPAFDGLAEALATSAPSVAVRVNAAKGLSPADGADTVPWCPQGVFLNERPAFTFDPRLHQGLYYVQDASSMILARIAGLLNTDEHAGSGPLRWLDACAAPGGKTTAVADSLADGSYIVANEFDSRRAAALVENVERWGCPRVTVTAGDTAAFTPLDGFFDVVAVDAPCSGEGMMRKEPEAVAQWSPALTERCAALQREIVANLWPAIRPGGYLVYSTCTFNTVENEENVRYFMDTYGATSVDLSLDTLPGVIPSLDSSHAARFLPGRVRGEGLFVSVLRKPGDSPAVPVSMPRKWRGTDLPDWLDGSYAGILAGQSLHAIPVSCAAAMLRIADVTRVLTQGVLAGVVKGRDLVPSQALATNTALRRGTFPEADVDRHSALAFLRGEPLHIDAPRGFVLLTYNHRPLGFVKNIGNRANNLLPDSRRIRSAIPAGLPPLPEVF